MSSYKDAKERKTCKNEGNIMMFRLFSYPKTQDQILPPYQGLLGVYLKTARKTFCGVF